MLSLLSNFLSEKSILKLLDWSKITSYLFSLAKSSIALNILSCIGEINYSTGDTIKAKFVDGVAEGYAEVIYSDKTIYNGTVSNNMSEGYAVQRNENGLLHF